MSQAQYEPLSNVLEHRMHVVRVLGGTNAITEAAAGEGLTATYVSAGRIRLTWSQSQNPGTFIGGTATFMATTPANVKSYVAVFGDYSTSARTIDVYMYESGTLTNLDAAEWITVVLHFQQTKGIF